MDTIANLLNSLVNAQRVGKERIAVPYSKFKEQLMLLFQAEGLIAKVRVQKAAKPKLIITLAYDDGTPKVSQAIRLSKPGRRLYVNHNKLPWESRQNGMYIVSTSKGLMIGKKARAEGLGGEIVCEIR